MQFCEGRRREGGLVAGHSQSGRVATTTPYTCGVSRIPSRDRFAPGDTPQCHALTEVAPRSVSRPLGTGTWMPECKKPRGAMLCGFAKTSILHMCSTVIIVTTMLKSFLRKIKRSGAPGQALRPVEYAGPQVQPAIVCRQARPGRRYSGDNVVLNEGGQMRHQRHAGKAECRDRESKSAKWPRCAKYCPGRKQDGCFCAGLGA
jgi:hypothetical protein